MILPMVASVCAVASAKTIDVYSVDDVLKASTTTAGGPFELILHDDIGVTGANTGIKWTNDKSLFFKSDYTIKSQSGGDYSISFTNGGKVQLQEVFNSCGTVVFENLHDVTFSGFSDVCAKRDHNTATGSGYDAESGAIMHASDVSFKNLSGKLTVSDSYFESGTMAASGMGNADASVMGIGFFCSSATFNNVAGGIEFSGIGVYDKLTTVIDWPRWIEMEGAAFLVSSATFSDNGGSIIFSDNYVRQHFQDGAEGAGYGAAVTLGGAKSVFSNNAGALQFSGNELQMATVGCGAALFMNIGSELEISGQHRDEAAGIDASISFTENRIIIQHDDGSKLNKDMYAYGGAVSLGFSDSDSDKNALLSITDNDCDVVFSGNYIDVNYKSTAQIDDNHVDVHGGAVYVDSGSILSITKNEQVEFSGNYIHFQYQDSNSDADAFAYGGALYLDKGAKAEFSNNAGAVIFSGNYVDISGYRVKGDGGAVMMRDGSSLVLKNNGASEFTWELPNRVGRRDGEFSAFFADNYINNGRGGAIFMEGSSKLSVDVMDGIAFVNNKATDGGAIYAGKGSTIEAPATDGNYIAFCGNEATRGGAIYLEEGAELNAYQLDFQYNSAQKGGGIYVTGSHEWSGDKIAMEFRYNKVTSTAYNTGGSGIYVNEKSGLTIGAKNLHLLFMQNEGGAIYSLSDFTISGSEQGSVTFYNNTSLKSAAAIFSYGKVTLANNGADFVFSFNESEFGSAINCASSDVDSIALLVQNNRGNISFNSNLSTSSERGGGAISSPNSYFYENQGSITFDGNSSNSIGGALTSTNLDFSDNSGDITFINNSSVDNGSAIHACNLSFLNNSGDITFAGNISTEGAGAIVAHYDNYAQAGGEVFFTENHGDISFLNNSSAQSGSAILSTFAYFNNNTAHITFENNCCSEGGGAVHVLKQAYFGENNSILFKNNTAVYGAALSGAALLYNTQGALEFIGNVATKAEGSKAAQVCAGGAIYMRSSDYGFDLQLRDNQSGVTFDGNRAEGSGAMGGAIYAGKDADVELCVVWFMDNKGGVTFKNNESGGDGGAIYADAYMNVGFYGNSGGITFTDNTAAGNGGALYAGEQTIVELESNKGGVTFKGNESGGSGGAIALQNGATLQFTEGSGQLLFENNVAKEWGGAIAAFGSASEIVIDFQLGDVIFRNNSAAAGRSIYSQGSVKIANNYGNVLFQEDGYAIHLVSTYYAQNENIAYPILTLSAAEGKSITFDNCGIFMEHQVSSPRNVAVELNTNAYSNPQTGTIIFTGEKSSSKLYDASLTLYNGRLQLEKGSSFSIVNSFTSHAEVSITGNAQLRTDATITFTQGSLELRDSRLSSASTSSFTQSRLFVENAEISATDFILTDYTDLTLAGNNTLTGNLNLDGRAYLYISGHTVVSKDITLTGSNNELNFSPEASHLMTSLSTAHEVAALQAVSVQCGLNCGQSRVTLNDENLDYLASGVYVLLSLEQGVQPVGNRGYVFALPEENVYWIDDGDMEHLVYAHTKPDVVWMNSSGSDLWNMEDANWVPVGGQRAIHFINGDNVWFTDACTDPAAVMLSTDVAPASVVVDATRDYTFSGEGSLTGDTSIVKKGSGALVLATENDFTGGVDLQEGTLCLHADHALGEGKLTTAEGTNLVVGNEAKVELRFTEEDAPLQADLEVQAGAALSVHGSYQAEQAVALSGEGKLSFSAENGSIALTLPGQYRGELVVDARQAAVTLHTQATGQTGACQVSGALRVLAEGASMQFDGSVAFMQDAELQLAAGTHFAVESGSEALASLLMSDGSTLHVGANDLEQVAALHLEDVLTAEISASGVYFEGSTTYVQEGSYITLLGDDNHLGFEGVGELLLQTDLAYTLGANGRKEFILFDGVESFFASDSFHFTVAGYEGETTYVEHRDGAVYVYVVPEPTTATLSMLALSLLMLRRRRR